MTGFVEHSDVTWYWQTYAEIRERAARDGSILLVPIGSVEQHGPHMPVATDTILATSVATEAARLVVDDVPILVTPPVWMGYSPHHLRFGGTITLEYEHLLHTVEDVVESALENGFDAVLLLNGHGGNMSLVDSAAYTIGTQQTGIEINSLTYFQLASDFVDDVRDSAIGGMSHAGEFETSLMLHLYPDCVRTDEMNGRPLESPYAHGLKDLFESGPLTTYKSFENYSPECGALGDPSSASEEKGRELFNGLTRELADTLHAIHDNNRNN